MKYILLMIILIFMTQLVSADYTFNNSTAWANSSFDHGTTDKGDGYNTVGVFANSFENGNTDGFSTLMGSAVFNVYNHPVDGYVGNISATSGMSIFGISSSYNNISIIMDINITSGNKDTGGIMRYQDTSNMYRGGSGGWGAYNHISKKISGSWSLLTGDGNVGDLSYNVEHSCVYGINGTDFITSTVGANTVTNDSVSELGSGDVGIYVDNTAIYFDNFRIVQYENNQVKTTGNVTHWYDAGSGYQGSQFKFIFNNDSNSFVEGWVSADNSTWFQVSDNMTNDTLTNIPTAHKNQTQYIRAVLKGNTTSAPKEVEAVITMESSMGSVDIIYYNLNFSHLPANVYINISNKTGNLSTINIPHTANDTHTYCFNYPNGTPVQSCITATSEGQIIWFNGSADRLPELSGYPINETEGAATSTIIIPANKLGMFNNWTVATNFSNIAANESNDICYSYYNVTTGEWESYYLPYTWNAKYDIPLEAGVFVFVGAETTITADIVTPSNTNLFTGWNMIFVMGTDNETVYDIKADIGVYCSDVWWYNSTAGAYSNTSTDTVQPGQGVIPHLTQNMTPWVRSDL